MPPQFLNALRSKRDGGRSGEYLEAQARIHEVAMTFSSSAEYGCGIGGMNVSNQLGSCLYRLALLSQALVECFSEVSANKNPANRLNCHSLTGMWTLVLTNLIFE
jgi:hypothetical protein